MTYYFIFLAPKIIQPSADFHRVAFDESTSSVNLTCSLDIAIPSSVMATWTHNNDTVMNTTHNEILQTGNTTTLLIRNPQPSDGGYYQCVFSELNLQRIIVLGESYNIIETLQESIILYSLLYS